MFLIVAIFYNLQRKGVFFVSNNIIDFSTVKSNTVHELNVTEIGNINITVYSESTTNSPIYYILPDKKELTPIVDFLNDTLTNNSFKLS